ncbi:hypothetical protein E0494_10765 [Marinilabiliaceae bacterium JC040]|nr:hypothetical protein [Marinilabiliaceae bacterium JC040]
MKNLIILPLIVVFLTSACQNVDVKQQIKKRYKNSIRFFEKDLVNHFPTNLPEKCWYSTTVPKTDTLKKLGFGVDKLFMIYDMSKYKSISSDIKDLPCTIYSANDSNLLLIFDYCDVIEIKGRKYRDQESTERQSLAKHNITNANSLPIPLFEIDQYKGNTMCGLSEDFKLYVLDSRSGKYIDDKYLQECGSLPEKWKHGYSKGFAMSDKKEVIIYWMIVW